ncbi:MAG: hypothetical protein VX615_04065 [Planctomycetota bacterium]|nr:hypothetical protein [Planctomycetota bacterium]
MTVACSTAFLAGGIIEINGSGEESFLLYSQPLGDIFGSDEAPEFSTDHLALVHEKLMSFGIDTDGKITVIPVDTNYGLSLLTLVDSEYGTGDNGGNSSLGLTSTAPNSLGFFINDMEQDDWQLISSPWLPSQTLGATFVWEGLTSGDGFAWTNLAIGDAISYSFVEMFDDDAIDAEAFQFVGASNNGLDVIYSDGFKSDGTSVFTATVVPAPPAGLLLSSLLLRYRRRRTQ